MFESNQSSFLGDAPRSLDTTEPERFTVVSVRLRVAELQEFTNQVHALGLTNSMALRIAARRIGGFLEVERDTRIDLENAMRLIEQVSSNLATLAKTYSANSADNLTEFKQERRALSEGFGNLESLLRKILNVSRRRIDGRLLLEAAGKHTHSKA